MWILQSFGIFIAGEELHRGDKIHWLSSIHDQLPSMLKFGLPYCLATNYRRVPIIARQNSNRYNFTKSSIPTLANKVQLFPK